MTATGSRVPASDSSGIRLLKVPRRLSDLWANAAPGSIVADIDFDAGLLTVNDKTAGRESVGEVFSMNTRAVQDLFAFQEARSGATIVGNIAEEVHLRSDV